MSQDIKIYFVLPSHCNDENSTTPSMRQAFELCCQNQLIPDWIGESNCCNLEFGKRDILVFEEFKGKVFNSLKDKKCLIAGPWCIITCLLDGLQVPNNRSPIYNMAMNKLTITASNFSAEYKKYLKEKIEMMGGIFSLHITSNVTHLITDSVRTQKYAVANEKNIIVMLDSWVDNVWNMSLRRNIHATDEEFLKHKCPVFKNLRFSCTGFEVNERNKLIKLIKDNGGSYSGKLVTSVTDILICNTQSQSEKFNVAKKANLPCLKIEWIYDSIKKGYAIPEINYVIKTPFQTNSTSKANLSMMSNISDSIINIPNKTEASDSINQNKNKNLDIVDNIDLQFVKKAGAFLDGCGVCLIGFKLEKREKLIRILKSSGATRYDDICDRITHIVADNYNLDLNKLHSLNSKDYEVPIVSVQWLVECIKQGHPVNAEPFIINTNSFINTSQSSPLSKKGLSLLQQTTSVNVTMPPFVTTASDSKQDDACCKLYMPIDITTNQEESLTQILMPINNATNQDEILTQENINTKILEYDENNTENEGIFKGKIFKLIHHEDDDSKKIRAIIENLGGEVVSVSFKGITDYVVVPVICNLVTDTATEIVNNLWVLECHVSQELISIAYYHQPIFSSTQLNILKDCIITISGYLNYERLYLIQLIQHLGAVYQDKFARVAMPEHNIKPSTHLICLDAIGSKYLAAIRWKKPIVNHKWLICCAEQGKKCDEKLFLLKSNNTEHSDSSTFETSILQQNYKRDIEGRKISPVQYLNETYMEILSKIDSPEKKFKSDNTTKVSNFTKLSENNTDLNSLHLENTEADKQISPVITVEDGRKIQLSKYMQELREQGLFDTPSPPPKQIAGTPISQVLSRLRQDGKIPPNKNETLSKQVSKNMEYNQNNQGVSDKFVKLNDINNVSQLSDLQFNDIKTPDTPLGRFLEDEPSRETKKYWQRYIDKFPHYKCHDRPPPKEPKHSSDQWPEAKKQAWAWLLREKSPSKELIDNNKDNKESTEKLIPHHSKEEMDSQRELSNKIGQLQNILRNRNNSTEGNHNGLLRLDGTAPQKLLNINNEHYAEKIYIRESQNDTVGWDETIENNDFNEQISKDTPDELCLRKFMLSALDPTIRSTCCNTIKALGCDVSELNHYDESCTHLVCSNPTRNEKILASIAAGKWIIHYSYITDSGFCGRFLNEELYEFGNPKALENISKYITKTKIMETIHWWRLKIMVTKEKAFHGMRALIFTKNKAAITRLIEAGGGIILHAEPPYNHTLNATHCFIDIKQKINLNDFVPLVKQGILCLNVLYLSNYLHNQGNADTDDFILPTLKKCYV